MGGVELDRVRQRLEVFAGQVFASLPRRDQHDKGATYLRGLLLDGARKSMQPMAARLGVDHQGLQQFVTSSTWQVAPVRAALATKAIDGVAPDAWVVDDTGFPKDGAASPGVARQYSGTLGKVGNCQIAVSVHAATDTGLGAAGLAAVPTHALGLRSRRRRGSRRPGAPAAPARRHL